MENSYIEIAKLDEIKPGKMLRVIVKDKKILLANVDGTIYAVEDMCSHEDASLYNGALKEDCVECPLHGSRFDLKTGIPKEAPATEPIATYSVKVEGNTILINTSDI